MLGEIAERPACTQDVAHPVPQHAPADGLADKVGRADLVGAVDGLEVVETGEHEHWHRRSGGERAQPGAQLIAVHLRHHHVQQHDVRSHGIEALHGGGPVRRLMAVKAGGFQRLADEQPHHGIVINHQCHRNAPVDSCRAHTVAPSSFSRAVRTSAYSASTTSMWGRSGPSSPARRRELQLFAEVGETVRAQVRTAGFERVRCASHRLLIVGGHAGAQRAEQFQGRLE